MDEKRLDRFEDKLDKVVNEITEIKVDLATHIYRTTLNEENVQMLRDDFKPVQRHVALANAALKILGVLALASGVIELLLKLL